MLLLFLSALTGLLINEFRPNGLPLIGDWSPQARMTLDSGNRIAISIEDAQALFDSGKAVFLDARPQGAFLDGHIQGAKSLPWNEFDIHMEDVIATLPEATPIITYCDGESCHLSKELAKALIEMGFANVRVLINGWGLWQSHGLPVSRGDDNVG